MKNVIALFAICTVFISCGTSKSESNVNTNSSSEGFKADSAYCAEWRGKTNQIRKSIPMTPDEVKKLGLPGNYRDYEGDTSGFPLISYSYFNSPAYGRTDFDKLNFIAEAPLTTGDAIAATERKNVWAPLESKGFIFIYFPESVNRTGGLNNKENISGKTTGVVLVYDLEKMQPKAAVSVEASFDTGKVYDAATGADLEKLVTDELRSGLVNNFVKH